MKHYYKLASCSRTRESFLSPLGRRDRQSHTRMGMAIAGDFSRTLISMVLQHRVHVSLLRRFQMHEGSSRPRS